MSKTRVNGTRPRFALLLTLPLVLGSTVAVAQQATIDDPEPAAAVTTTETATPATPPRFAENTLEGCRDGVDNDGDGHVDCDDQDCEIYAMCVQPAEEPETSGHTGFFLRFLLGPGGGGFAVTGEIDRLDLGSNSRDRVDDFNFAWASTLSLGGALKENLILHGDLTSVIIAAGDNEVSDPGLAVGGIGLGVTYYFMPVNWYLTGSVGYAGSVLSVDENPEDQIGNGVYVMIVIGKEWMVSKNWGLGIAGQGLYSYGQHDSIHYNQGSFAVLFSATFN